jgi:hypothetical protein
VGQSGALLTKKKQMNNAITNASFEIVSGK